MSNTMSSQPAKILLCDDHNLYRECLRGFFERWSEFEVIAEAKNGLEAVEEYRRERPDLVLMDVEMPVMSGIEAARRILDEDPGASIVMLTVSTSEDNLVDAIKGGARGYILKSVHARELRDGLNAALAGEVILSSEATMLCLDVIKRGFVPERSGGEPSRALLATLTDQERQILYHVALGESNKEIGSRLYIGESTVKKRFSTILAKLGLENRVQAAVFAIHSGLVQ